MTSLFSRLQKLNKEGTPPPWKASRGSTFNQAELRAPDPWNGLMLIRRAVKEEDIDLIVECRNSLPAVLNLIEAAQQVLMTRDAFITGTDEADVDIDELLHAWVEAMRRMREAVAVFVSGQEEPSEGAR